MVDQLEQRAAAVRLRGSGAGPIYLGRRCTVGDDACQVGGMLGDEKVLDSRVCLSEIHVTMEAKVASGRQSAGI